MRIYIAASWKHEHCVRLLTEKFRALGHKVLSFVENEQGVQKGHEAVDGEGKAIPLDEWIWSDRGERSFKFDTESATGCDLVVYLGPSGTDAWAEVGAAWASGVPIVGLHAKGEPSGLMRRMVIWCKTTQELLGHLAKEEQ